MSETNEGYGQPCERTQHDGMGDKYSAMTATDFTGTDSLARQEFKDEADTNIMLTRFGVIPQRPIQYGTTVDYQLDLQTALGVLAEVETATFNVPTELQVKYPDWRTLLNAVETGEYENDLNQLAEQKAKESNTENKPNPT